MRIVISALIFFFLTSCEEVIHVDLNSANPRYVIEAELDNLSRNQVIRVSQTVSFEYEMPSKPIPNASVVVSSDNGTRYVFLSKGDGQYENSNFMPRIGTSYTLEVRVDDALFTAQDHLRDFINVDSLGILEETVFNEVSYAVLVKFTDPIKQADYYKYQVSVNGEPFRFLQVQNDKFNDGLYVTHQLSDFDKPFKLNDQLVIRRQIIGKDVFDYWNQIQFMNPGNAAPANPKSNISNGALGYFSVSNSKDYPVEILPVSTQEEE